MSDWIDLMALVIIAGIAGLATFATSVCPAAADGAMRFDMTCRGHSTVTAKGIAPLVKKEESRMSVDLSRRLWCWRKGDGCFQVLAVQGVAGDVLTLRDVDDETGEAHIRLDLADGQLTSHLHIKQQPKPAVPDLVAVVDAHCTKAPFTAIP